MYICNYCNIEHEDDTKSEEHIIPKSLLNKTFVLKNVCKRTNNLIAHAVEKKILESDLVREILLRIEPHRKDVFVGKIVTETGEKHDRWINNKGQQILADRPRYERKSSITISVKKRTGELIDFDLKLPFDMITGGYASNNFWDKTDPAKKAKESVKQLQDYLDKCLKTPETNQELKAFLEENNAELREKEIVLIEEKLLAQEKLFDNLEINLKQDQEIWAMFFLKIAWTYSCRQLGREALKNNLSESILNFFSKNYLLINGDLNTTPLKKILRGPTTIKNENYYFWEYSIEKTQDFFEKFPESLKAEFKPVLEARIRGFEISKSLMFYGIKKDFSNINCLDKTLRKHRIKFIAMDISYPNEDSSNQKKQATGCEIELFGGIIYAQILISESVIHTEELSIEICF